MAVQFLLHDFFGPFVLELALFFKRLSVVVVPLADHLIEIGVRQFLPLSRLA